MRNVTENLRKQNITVSLHEKNNIYQAVINYKDDNNKRKQKWVSTGIKVARGNKRLALQKAEDIESNLKNLLICKNTLKRKMMNKLKSVCYLEKSCI